MGRFAWVRVSVGGAVLYYFQGRVWIVLGGATVSGLTVGVFGLCGSAWRAFLTEADVSASFAATVFMGIVFAGVGLGAGGT